MAVITHSSSAVVVEIRSGFQTALAEELPRLETSDDRLLALLGQHDNFDAAFWM